MRDDEAKVICVAFQGKLICNRIIDKSLLLDALSILFLSSSLTIATSSLYAAEVREA